MSAFDDRIYFEERERSARACAAVAATPAIRAIHEELAARYRGLALAAGYREKGQAVPDRG